MSSMAAANRLLKRTLSSAFRVVFAWPTLRPTATLPSGFSAILLAAVGVRVARTVGQLSKLFLLSILREVVPRTVGLTAEARLSCVRSGGKGQASVADRWLKRAFNVVDVLVSSLLPSLRTSLRPSRHSSAPPSFRTLNRLI